MIIEGNHTGGSLLFALLLAGTARGQMPRRLDLERYSFPSAAAERQARSELQVKEALLTRALDSASRSPRALAAALVIFDSVTAMGTRHWWYLRLRCATDVSDRACHDANEISAQLAAATGEVQQWIAGQERAGRLARAVHDPALQRYAFLIKDFLRTSRHVLSRPVTSAIERLSGPATTWEFPEYLATMSHVAPPPAVTPQASKTERAAAYRARLTNMAAFGDLFALSLIETVRGRDALAEAQGYPSAPAQVFDRRYLNLDSVRAVLSAVRSHGALAKVYEQDQLAHASLSTTDTSVGPWDLARARPPAPRVPLDTAIVLMRRALAALGPEYEEALERMLEPSSGRLDLGPGSHRTPGGFSFGTLGFPTGVYLSAYDSTPTGARRLVHESGHAMHRQLMIDAGAAPVYLSGSPWQSEAVSLFNELVVMDYAAAAAKSAADRARFEEAFLGKALDVFYSAQDAELELGVYDGVKRGTLRSPADFDSLSRSVDTAYTIWAARIPELAHRWIQVRLMWEDPLYLANYVYADLIGLKLFAMYEQDRRAFAPKYIGFLRAGYSDEPAVLIKHYFQFDLDPHSLLDDALRLVDARLRAYEMP